MIPALRAPRGRLRQPRPRCGGRRRGAGPRAPHPSAGRPPAKLSSGHLQKGGGKKATENHHQPSPSRTKPPPRLSLPRREHGDAGTTRRPRAGRAAPLGAQLRAAAPPPRAAPGAAGRRRGRHAEARLMAAPSSFPPSSPSSSPPSRRSRARSLHTHTHTHTERQTHARRCSSAHGGRRGPAERDSPSLGLGAPRGRCEPEDRRGCAA